MLFFTLPAGLTALCLVTLINAADTVCYFPNGSPSTDVPCNPSTPFSMCCSSATACLSSGFCKSVSTNGTSADTDKFVRATCTDPSWDSAVCPPYCLPRSTSNGTATIFNLNLSQNNVHIRQCQAQGLGESATFCCGLPDEQTQCCENRNALFSLTNAQAPVALNPAASLSPDATILASPDPPKSTSESISSWNTPKGPGIVVASAWCPSGQCGTTNPTTRHASISATHTQSSQRTSSTAADLRTSDSSVPSTDPPSTVLSPTVSATSTPASSASTSHRATGAQAAAPVKATALADSTSGSTSNTVNVSNTGTGSSGISKSSGDDDDDNDDNGDNSDSKETESTSTWSEWEKKASNLSTAAVVGIGLGASMAAAGLVTIAVYIFARRRLYMKQKRRWEEQMKTRGGPGAPPGMVAVQTTTADGKPAVVMLQQAQQGTWVPPSSEAMLKTPAVEANTGLSPVSTRMGWGETRAVSEYSEAGTRSSTAASLQGQPVAAEAPAAAVVVEDLKPDPRGGKTATWMARHSYYEMG